MDSTDAGARYGDGTYRAHHPGWHAERAPWKAAHVVRGLAAAGVRPASLVDVGCGTGRVAAQVAARLAAAGAPLDRVEGCEPGADAPLHPEAEGVVTVHRAGVEAIADRFDVALLMDVVEHVEDPVALVRRVASAAPVVVLHIPLEVNVGSVLTGRLGHTRATLGHLHHYTRRTALGMVTAAGLTVVHAHPTRTWEGKKVTAASLLRRAIAAVSDTACERLVGGVSLLVVARTATAD